MKRVSKPVTDAGDAPAEGEMDELVSPQGRHHKRIGEVGRSIEKRIETYCDYIASTGASSRNVTEPTSDRYALSEANLELEEIEESIKHMFVDEALLTLDENITAMTRRAPVNALGPLLREKAENLKRLKQLVQKLQALRENEQKKLVEAVVAVRENSGLIELEAELSTKLGVANALRTECEERETLLNVLVSGMGAAEKKMRERCENIEMDKLLEEKKLYEEICRDLHSADSDSLGASEELERAQESLKGVLRELKGGRMDEIRHRKDMLIDAIAAADEDYKGLVLAQSHIAATIARAEQRKNGEAPKQRRGSVIDSSFQKVQLSRQKIQELQDDITLRKLRIEELQNYLGVKDIDRLIEEDVLSARKRRSNSNKTERSKPAVHPVALPCVFESSGILETARMFKSVLEPHRDVHLQSLHPPGIKMPYRFFPDFKPLSFHGKFEVSDETSLLKAIECISAIQECLDVPDLPKIDVYSAQEALDLDQKEGVIKDFVSQNISGALLSHAICDCRREIQRTYNTYSFRVGAAGSDVPQFLEEMRDHFTAVADDISRSNAEMAELQKQLAVGDKRMEYLCEKLCEEVVEIAELFGKYGGANIDVSNDIHALACISKINNARRISRRWREKVRRVRDGYFINIQEEDRQVVTADIDKHEAYIRSVVEEISGSDGQLVLKQQQKLVYDAFLGSTQEPSAEVGGVTNRNEDEIEEDNTPKRRVTLFESIDKNMSAFQRYSVVATKDSETSHRFMSMLGDKGGASATIRRAQRTGQSDVDREAKLIALQGKYAHKEAQINAQPTVKMTRKRRENLRVQLRAGLEKVVEQTPRRGSIVASLELNPEHLSKILALVGYDEPSLDKKHEPDDENEEMRRASYFDYFKGIASAFKRDTGTSKQSPQSIDPSDKTRSTFRRKAKYSTRIVDVLPQPQYTCMGDQSLNNDETPTPTVEKIELKSRFEDFTDEIDFETDYDHLKAVEYSQNLVGRSTSAIQSPRARIAKITIGSSDNISFPPAKPIESTRNDEAAVPKKAYSACKATVSVKVHEIDSLIITPPRGMLLGRALRSASRALAEFDARICRALLRDRLSGDPSYVHSGPALDITKGNLPAMIESAAQNVDNILANVSLTDYMNGLLETPGFANGPHQNSIPQSRPLSGELASKMSAAITDASSASTTFSASNKVDSAMPCDSLRSLSEQTFREDCFDTDEAPAMDISGHQQEPSRLAYCDIAPLFPWEQSVKMSRKEVEMLSTKLRGTRGKSVALNPIAYLPSDRLPEIAVAALAQDYRKLGTKEPPVSRALPASGLEGKQKRNSGNHVSIYFKERFKLNKENGKNRIVLSKVINDATGQESFVFKKLD